MNLIEIAEQLKGVPDAYLQQESNNPSGFAPPFLVLGEISRRSALRQKAAAPAPSTTVQQDLTRAIPGGQMPQVLPPGPMPPQLSMNAMPPAVGLGAGYQQQQQAQRMRSGGLVQRLAGGGSPSSFTYNPWFLPSSQQDEEEQRRQAAIPKMIRQPNGDVIINDPNGNGVSFPRLPVLAPYEAHIPDPIHIEDPAIEPLLERARAMSGPPTEGYADRIKELETERKKIRQPTVSEWLIQTGQGLLASNAQNPWQAFGQASLHATQDSLKRRDYADEQRRQMTERIAAARMQQEQEARRREAQEVGLASQMQQRLHGSAITDAQALMSQRVQEEAARRTSYEQQAAQQRAQHEWDTRLAQTFLTQANRIDPLDPRYEAKDDRKAARQHAYDMELEEKRAQDHLAQVMARGQYTGVGSSGWELKEQLKDAKLRDQAGALIHHQLEAYADPKLDARAMYAQARDYVLKNLDEVDKDGTPKNYKNLNPLLRQMLRDRIEVYAPPGGDKYYDGLEDLKGTWLTNRPKGGKDADPAKALEGLLGDRFNAADPNMATYDMYGRPVAPAQGTVAAPAGGPGQVTRDDVLNYKPDGKKTAPVVVAPVPTPAPAARPAASYVPPDAATGGIAAGVPQRQASTADSYLPAGPGQLMSSLGDAFSWIGEQNKRAQIAGVRREGRLSANTSTKVDPSDPLWQANAEDYREWLSRTVLKR